MKVAGIFMYSLVLSCFALMAIAGVIECNIIAALLGILPFGVLVWVGYLILVDEYEQTLK